MYPCLYKQGSKYKIKAQDSVIEANSSELKNKIMQQIPNDLPKTKQLLSTIKTALNTTTKYFDLKSQTSENEAVRAVCFSPEKRVTLHQLQQKKSPVKIVGPNYLPKKDSRHLLKNTPFPRNSRSLQPLCNSHSRNLSVTDSTLSVKF